MLPLDSGVPDRPEPNGGPVTQPGSGISGRRHEVEREFVANALYLGLVLYAGLAVVPSDNLPSDLEVVLLILATGLGLILAHYFAFHVASAAVSAEGRGPEGAAEEAWAQVAGGTAVSVVASLPFLFLDGEQAVDTTLFILSGLPAAAGFAIGRRRGHSVLRSALMAGLVFVVAVGVVTLKISVAH